ncbi:chalcone isomerase family protein [Pseudomonas lurida]|uniref:chalcone isomerase family protein n=1 Tax=Pseudomonas lurida TaxID=244566 RepID=UPI00165739D2|nr:chalcone isomerase family protein [Pseudomonas lurida]MBC8982382.1 chalcone isomerase family protein [Pseudomonas lurida]
MTVYGISALRALVLSGLLASGWCSAATWRNEVPQAQALGGGEMRFLGFSIYHATLWADQKPYQQGRTFALQLTYHRSIARDRLVQTSIDEIRRISNPAIDASTLTRWENVLRGAMVDVAEGDQLIGVYVPERGMRLYSKQTLLADIKEPELARAFFAIWLDPATRDQGLRRQLLGQP